MTSFSSTAGNVQEGSLRHYPDIRYRYDEGFLTVYGPFEDGKAPLLFQGRADDDGLFRLPNGAIVAGDKKPGVVLNEYGIASIRERSREGLRAYYAAQRGDDDPKLCPDPTPERPTRDKNKFTVIWRVYQHQVTGVPYGYAVDLHGVEFDGCILIDGTGQETKALGFRKFIEGEEFKRWFSGRKAIVKQLSNQSRVAALDGRMVVWYVAEEEMVAMVARLIEQHGLNNVFVTHRPFVPPKAGL